MSSPLMIASVSPSTTLILMEKTENVLPIVDFNHLPFADYHKGKRHLQQAKRKEDDDNLSSPLKNASTPTPSSLILLRNRIDLLHLAPIIQKSASTHTIFTHPSTKHNRLASFSRHHLSRRFTTNVLYKHQETEFTLCPHLS